MRVVEDKPVSPLFRSKAVGLLAARHFQTGRQVRHTLPSCAKARCGALIRSRSGAKLLGVGAKFTPVQRFDGAL